jgi:hypothetical protein
MAPFLLPRNALIAHLMNHILTELSGKKFCPEEKFKTT